MDNWGGTSTWGDLFYARGGDAILTGNREGKGRGRDRPKNCGGGDLGRMSLRKTALGNREGRHEVQKQYKCSTPTSKIWLI